MDQGLKQSGVSLINGRADKFEVLRTYLPKSQYKDWVNVSHDIVSSTIRWFVEFCQSIKDSDIIDLALEEPMIPVFARSGAFAKQNKLYGALVYGFSRIRQIGDIYAINPRSMKKVFTGNGNAGKARIVKRARLYYDVNLWPASKADKEALADAIGIGYTLWKHRGFARNGVHLIRGIK